MKHWLSVLAAVCMAAAALLSPGPAYAQSCTADIASWNTASRDLQTCFGGLSDRMGWIFGQNNNVSVTVPLWSDGQPQSQGPDGYFTCLTVLGVNRAVGSLDISAAGPRTCSTSTATDATVPGGTLVPADWNPVTSPFTEGAPWSNAGYSPVCNFIANSSQKTA
jgi:hypothetical protein